MELNNIFDVVFFKDINDKLQELAKLSPEQWSFKGKNDNGILKNYLKYTFRKIVEEGKFIETDNYAIFNTGLFTEYYEPIYFYMEFNKANGNQKWFLKTIGTEYDMGQYNIVTLPKRADYFKDTSLLVFDANSDIRVQFKHILQDDENLKRMPKEIQSSKNIQQILIGAIDIMKKKVTANYKIAVPQYFNGNIQLLLPLCLLNNETPDLALVVTKNQYGNFYQGHTCLTMEMAYTNARLIAKPESNWLLP